VFQRFRGGSRQSQQERLAISAREMHRTATSSSGTVLDNDAAIRVAMTP